MGLLFILFAVMPIIEITLLIHVGEMIGGWNTVAIVIATAFIGAYLVKREGLSTLLTAQQKMQQGQVPGEELAQGLLLVIAGVLLVTPGFVTDIIGLLFTLPPTRKLLAKAVLLKLANSASVTTSFSANQQFYTRGTHDPSRRKEESDDIIEGEYHETGHAQIDDQDSDSQRKD